MDKEYPRFHRNRTNLLIHIVAVPIFIAGVGGLVVGGFLINSTLMIAGPVAMVLSLAAQGRGHKLEQIPPKPFTGPGNFLFRIFREQFVTFPWFVVSGGLSTALREK